MKAPFLSRCNRAGVAHVLAHVRPFIDTGDHEIRLSRQQDPDPEKYRIRGGAIRGENAIAEVFDAQGLVEGDRVAHARPLLSGAMTHTSSIGARASFSACSPSEPMPSSFERRMSKISPKCEKANRGDWIRTSGHQHPILVR